MSIKSASHDRTICEVIRKINDLAQGNDPKDSHIRSLCTEAEIMAKKMALRLIEYKKELGGDSWYQWEKNNPTVVEDLKRRLDEAYKVAK